MFLENLNILNSLFTLLGVAQQRKWKGWERKSIIFSTSAWFCSRHAFIFNFFLVQKNPRRLIEKWPAESEQIWKNICQTTIEKVREGLSKYFHPKDGSFSFHCPPGRHQVGGNQCPLLLGKNYSVPFEEKNGFMKWKLKCSTRDIGCKDSIRDIRFLILRMRKDI